MSVKNKLDGLVRNNNTSIIQKKWKLDIKKKIFFVVPILKVPTGVKNFFLNGVKS